MGVSLSLTTQKSKSQQHAESDAVAGSTLNAGNNLSITANGKNKGDSGDIVIAGSQLKAGATRCWMQERRHSAVRPTPSSPAARTAAAVAAWA
jgi:hypothetical protein